MEEVCLQSKRWLWLFKATHFKICNFNVRCRCSPCPVSIILFTVSCHLASSCWVLASSIQPSNLSRWSKQSQGGFKHNIITSYNRYHWATASSLPQTLTNWPENIHFNLATGDYQSVTDCCCEAAGGWKPAFCLLIFSLFWSLRWNYWAGSFLMLPSVNLQCYSPALCNLSKEELARSPACSRLTFSANLPVASSLLPRHCSLPIQVKLLTHT